MRSIFRVVFISVLINGNIYSQTIEKTNSEVLPDHVLEKIQSIDSLISTGELGMTIGCGDFSSSADYHDTSRVYKSSSENLLNDGLLVFNNYHKSDGFVFHSRIEYYMGDDVQPYERSSFLVPEDKILYFDSGNAKSLPRKVLKKIRQSYNSWFKN